VTYIDTQALMIPAITRELGSKPYIVVTTSTSVGILADTRCSLARRIDSLFMPLAEAVDKAVTMVIYRCVERPIKRLARKIAMSGHWSY
jgi:hypothetical protein